MDCPPLLRLSEPFQQPKRLKSRLSGRISIDPTAREDVTLVPVPRECIGYVMGDKSGCSDTKHQTTAYGIPPILLRRMVKVLDCKP